MGPEQQFQRKLMSQSRENVRTDGRTDERTDNTPNNTPKFICLKSIKKIFKFSFSQIIKGDFES